MIGMDDALEASTARGEWAIASSRRKGQTFAVSSSAVVSTSRSRSAAPSKRVTPLIRAHRTSGPVAATHADGPQRPATRVPSVVNAAYAPRRPWIIAPFGHTRAVPSRKADGVNGVYEAGVTVTSRRA